MTPTPEQWNQFVRQHPHATPLQLAAWAELKGAFGWQSTLAAVMEDGAIVGGAQILFRKLPIGKLAYIPYAPLTDWHDLDLTKRVFAEIHQTTRQQGAAFLKVEAGIGIDPKYLEEHGFQLSTQTVQPPNTMLIDLADDDTMLKRMNQGTRRNIRKSDKFEVSIREGSRADVDSFNAMLDETGNRQAFGVHAADYYEKAYDLFVPSGDAVLLIASYEQTDLAGIFVFKIGQGAWYLYGASRNIERKRMASFGVQWAGIQWARDHGCTVYDMVGIPDADEDTLEAQFQDRDDGLWGVYRFKRGWGGRVARSVGAWDYVYNPIIYRLYNFALRVRG